MGPLALVHSNEAVLQIKWMQSAIRPVALYLDWTIESLCANLCSEAGFQRTCYVAGRLDGQSCPTPSGEKTNHTHREVQFICFP